MIDIEPTKSYSKADIKKLLDFTDKQLKIAEEQKLIIFSNNSIYGVYFFQFLKNNYKQLEAIHETQI